MTAFKALVIFTCLYLSLVYEIFFLFFEAYPIVFQAMCVPSVPAFRKERTYVEPGIYSFNPGMSGLAFLPGKRYSKPV